MFYDWVWVLLRTIIFKKEYKHKHLKERDIYIFLDFETIITFCSLNFITMPLTISIYTKATWLVFRYSLCDVTQTTSFLILLSPKDILKLQQYIVKCWKNKIVYVRKIITYKIGKKTFAVRWQDEDPRRAFWKCWRKWVMSSSSGNNASNNFSRTKLRKRDAKVNL